MLTCTGIAARNAKDEMNVYRFERREPRANEVAIEVTYCGVCHSDLHQARNDWHNTLYPCLPGHEVVGTVSAVGGSVKKFKVGDIVGVGCMVDSCLSCAQCQKGDEQYCEKGFTATYNGNMYAPKQENHTYGGYSSRIVVREHFVLAIPPALKPEIAGPILCAGITTYSPLKHWKVGKGTRVGVIGVGGLGQMAIKLAVALGAEVTAISRSDRKADEARKIGARKLVVSTDENSMKAQAGQFDFILSTIPVPFDLNPYVPLLAVNGTLVNVGCVAPLTKPLDISGMVIQRKSVGASLIGGIAETQEVLEFCAKHGIAPETKLIKAAEINDAFKELEKGDVGYRFVIDMRSLGDLTTEKGGYDKLPELGNEGFVQQLINAAKNLAA